MAANLRKKMSKDRAIYVFDVFRPACERFVEEFSSLGPVEIVDSPRAAAAAADVVVSMVPGSKEVKAVYLDRTNGIIAAPADPERLVLECSTVDTETARSVAKTIQVAGRGVYVDSPVSVR